MKVYIKQNRFLNNAEITEEEIQELLNDGFKEIELNDKYADCTFLDFDNWQTFNVGKYNARHEMQKDDEYVAKVVELIRKRYSINDELAILRQRDVKPEEFDEYNTYVEECKAEAKGE